MLEISFIPFSFSIFARKRKKIFFSIRVLNDTNERNVFSFFFQKFIQRVVVNFAIYVANIANENCINEKKIAKKIDEIMKISPILQNLLVAFHGILINLWFQT